MITIDDLPGEVWKQIEESNGLYFVSNKGRIKRIAGEELIHQTEFGKYKSVSIRDSNGKYKSAIVHRLVAKAFVDNPNGYDVVNHKDEDPWNNCSENLEWCTTKYNNNYGTANMRKSEKARIRRETREYLIKQRNYVKEFREKNL